MLRGYDGQIMVRPPYGNANEYVRENSNVTFINWSVDSNDWRYKDGKSVCDTVVEYAHDGGIVLMHDLYSSTVEGSKCALEKLSVKGINSLRSKNYSNHVTFQLNQRKFTITHKKGT
ncbi:hypothetical protein MGH68_02640 [Erysipelothrix sp. D19-032]